MTVPLPESEAKTTDVTVSAWVANLFGLAVLGVFFLSFEGAFRLGWGRSLLAGAPSFFRLTMFLPVLILGTVAHEALHALGWMVFGGVSRKEIRFGVLRAWLTPYAHCRVPLNISAYRAGGILPGIVLGALPAAVGLAFGLDGLAFWGAVFLGVAGGDFLILLMIRKFPREARVLDHPDKIRCRILLD